MMMLNAGFNDIQNVDLQSMAASLTKAAEGETSALSFDEILAAKVGCVEAPLNYSVASAENPDNAASDLTEILESFFGELQGEETQDLSGILEILGKLIEEYRDAIDFNSDSSAYNSVMAYLADFLAAIQSLSTQAANISESNTIAVGSVDSADSLVEDEQGSNFTTGSKMANTYHGHSETGLESSEETASNNEVIYDDAETDSLNGFYAKSDNNGETGININDGYFTAIEHDATDSATVRFDFTNDAYRISQESGYDNKAEVTSETELPESREMLNPLAESVSPKEIAEKLFEKLIVKLEQTNQTEQNSGESESYGGLQMIKDEIVISRTVVRGGANLPHFVSKEELNQIIAAMSASGENAEVNADDQIGQHIPAVNNTETDSEVADAQKSLENTLRLGRTDKVENSEKTAEQQSGDGEKANTAPIWVDRAFTFKSEIDHMIGRTHIQSPAAQIGEQIAARMTNLENGATEFEIQLAPIELGKVSIKLVAKGNEIELKIIAERPETAAMLRNKAADMSEALRQNNAQLEKYVVYAEGEADAQQSYLRQEGRQGGGNERQRQERQTAEPEDTDNDTVSFLELMRSMA